MSAGLTSVKSQLRLPGTRFRQGPPEVEWERLGGMLTPYFRGGFFTVLSVDLDSNLVRRSFSTDEASYPCGGSKALMGTPWAQHVIHQGQCFIAGTAADMKWAFSDYQTLFDLGCTTALNLPIRQGSGVAWTLNLLRGEDPYSVAECGEITSLVESWTRDISAPLTRS